MVQYHYSYNNIIIESHANQLYKHDNRNLNQMLKLMVIARVDKGEKRVSNSSIYFLRACISKLFLK